MALTMLGALDMYKLNLVKAIYKGRSCPKLICIDEQGRGFEFIPFRIFLTEMIDASLAPCSVTKYLYCLMGFLRYLLTGFELAGAVSAAVGNQLCNGYYSYLVHGVASADGLIKDISIACPRRSVSPRTARNYHVVVTQFLCLSNVFLVDLRHSNASALGNSLSVNMLVALQEFSSRILLVGRLSLWGTGRKNVGKARRLYRDIPRNNPQVPIIDQSKFFPLELISNLIQHATCYRDAAIWCLLAASGLRVSEVLQLLWEDIDFSEGKVYAVNPKEREDIKSSYVGLGEIEINKLSWKGRRTKFTFLIEPYAEMFFEALALYMKYEYDAKARHNFIFQGADAKPLRFCDYKFNLIRPFQTAATKVLGEDASKPYKMKLHSLRHSFCVFLKNFILHTEGMGLSDGEIILLTGHASVESIQTYAIIDKVKIEEKLALAFSMRDNRHRKSFNELMLIYHTDRAKTFKKMVEEESKSQEANAA
jgi:integrase